MNYLGLKYYLISKLFQQIELKLCSDNSRIINYKDMIIGYDKKNESSNYEIHVIVQKSTMLCKSYMFVFGHMKYWKWSECCQASL